MSGINSIVNEYIEQLQRHRDYADELQRHRGSMTSSEYGRNIQGVIQRRDETFHNLNLALQNRQQQLYEEQKQRELQDRIERLDVRLQNQGQQIGQMRQRLTSQALQAHDLMTSQLQNQRQRRVALSDYLRQQIGAESQEQQSEGTIRDQIRQFEQESHSQGSQREFYRQVIQDVIDRVLKGEQTLKVLQKFNIKPSDLGLEHLDQLTYKNLGELLKISKERDIKYRDQPLEGVLLKQIMIDLLENREILNQYDEELVNQELRDILPKNVRDLFIQAKAQGQDIQQLVDQMERDEKQMDLDQKELDRLKQQAKLNAVKLSADVVQRDKISEIKKHIRESKPKIKGQKEKREKIEINPALGFKIRTLE